MPGGCTTPSPRRRPRPTAARWGDVHYHEVGALDAVADVTGVCYALYLLHPDRVVVSPVHVGSGTVRCAHGVMPVPAPATANLLTGVPVYGGEVMGELCTPTGAALLTHFAQSFGPMPPMKVDAVGCGVGTKAFEGRANCVRAILGEDGSSRQWRDLRAGVQYRRHDPRGPGLCRPAAAGPGGSGRVHRPRHHEEGTGGPCAHRFVQRGQGGRAGPGGVEQTTTIVCGCAAVTSTSSPPAPKPWRPAGVRYRSRPPRALVSARLPRSTSQRRRWPVPMACPSRPCWKKCISRCKDREEHL